MDYQQLLSKAPEHLRTVYQMRLAGTQRHGKLAIGFGVAETAGENALLLAGANKNALMVVDKAVRKFGIHEPVVKSMEDAGFKLDFYDDIPPEPHIEAGRAIQESVRSKNYGVIIAVGGGSTMDIAKAAAMLATNPLDVEKYFTGSPIVNASLPLILLPTTAGTGSEVSCVTVMATEERKIFLADPVLYAEVSLVDPLLTVSCPPSVTAATGLDALSHGMEGITSRVSEPGKLFAYKCAEYTFKYLPRAVKDPNDLEARYYMSLATVYGVLVGGFGLYSHSMSYIMTLDKHIPHGTGCGITLPYTFMYNYSYVKDLLVDLARVIEPAKSGTEDELARFMLEKFFLLLDECGMPRGLKGLGIEEEKIDEYAKDLFTKNFRPLNPRKLTQEDALKLVRLMWEGRIEIF